MGSSGGKSTKLRRYREPGTKTKSHAKTQRRKEKKEMEASAEIAKM
jgi:hypothetical protein